MKYRGYNPKRDKSEPIIVQTLESAGCEVIRLNTPVDLVILTPEISRKTGQRVTLMAECKTPGSKPEGKQLAYIKEHNIPVLESADDAAALLNRVRLGTR